MIAPDRTYDPIRFHRGTRGFAAFVTGLNGFVVLGATLFVVPTLGLDPLVATWAVILGDDRRHRPLRRDRRAHPRPSLGRRRSSATSPPPASRSRVVRRPAGRHRPAIFGAEPGTALGFFIWMIGSWPVATRFAFKPFTFTPQAHRVMARVAEPVARRAPGDRCSASGRSSARRRRRPGSATARPAARRLGRLRHPAQSRQDVRPVSAGRTRVHHPVMDSVGMVIIAISALALLEVAAANLRGESASAASAGRARTRPLSRPGRASRSRMASGRAIVYSSRR